MIRISWSNDDSENCDDDDDSRVGGQEASRANGNLVLGKILLSAIPYLLIA